MSDTHIRMTVEFDIDEEALAEHDLSAKDIYDGLVFYEDDVIDGFKLSTDIPGLSPTIDCFLCDGTVVSKKIIPARSLGNSLDATKIKVIIYDGIVEAVLTDQNSPVQVEVIAVNKDYADYDQLEEYRDSLYADESLHNSDFVVANFEEELESYIAPPDEPSKDGPDNLREILIGSLLDAANSFGLHHIDGDKAVDWILSDPEFKAMASSCSWYADSHLVETEEVGEGDISSFQQAVWDTYDYVNGQLEDDMNFFGKIGAAPPTPDSITTCSKHQTAPTLADQIESAESRAENQHTIHSEPIDRLEL